MYGSQFKGKLPFVMPLFGGMHFIRLKKCDFADLSGFIKSFSI